MKPIITHHIKATASRGERVRATINGTSSTVPCNPTLTKEQNHTLAAQALARKHNLRGLWHGAPCNSGFVFVNSSTPGAFFYV